MRDSFSCLILYFFAMLIGSLDLAASTGLPSISKQNPPVTAQLIAEPDVLRPNKPFTLAVQLDHAPHWHSYWLNPGTGYKTSINWAMPAGFTAGPIQWPTPHLVRDAAGNITGYGYEGRVLLLTEVTPPASIESAPIIRVQGQVSWLMCSESCVPGEAEVSLSLPWADEPIAENSASSSIFNEARAQLPRDSSDWSFTALRKGNTIELRLVCANPDVKNQRRENLYFFDADGLIDYAAPQRIRQESDVIVIEMQVSADAPDKAAELRGVLAADSGLFPDQNSYAGLNVFTPLVEAAPPINSALSPAHPQSPPPTFAGTLLIAFLGGLILNLMPCVFPVLGIKILGFVNQSGGNRASTVRHGLAFAGGVLISFWALAGLLLALRAGGAQLGWGFQLQSPSFVFAMAAFLLLFAFSLSGVLEVGLSATGVGAGLQSRDGFIGSFFTGALATLVATPCSAPFLAAALPVALTLPATAALIVFTAIALGLSLPYLLLSIFPAAVRVLPRPGAWMETFKQLMAFPLYATVAWLVWVLAAQTADDDLALRNILFALVGVALSAWLYGRFGQPHGTPLRRRLGLIAALLSLAGSLWLGWPNSADPSAAAPSAHGKTDLVWHNWSPEAVANAIAAGRPVYVDFTARWCATCQTNKAIVFSSAEVRRTFAERDVLLLRADWTSRDPAITTELARWGKSAVPFNLLYLPGHDAPVELPTLLTPGVVLEALGHTER